MAAAHQEDHVADNSLQSDDDFEVIGQAAAFGERTYDLMSEFDNFTDDDKWASTVSWLANYDLPPAHRLTDALDYTARSGRGWRGYVIGAMVAVLVQHGADVVPFTRVDGWLIIPKDVRIDNLASLLFALNPLSKLVRSASTNYDEYYAAIEPVVRGLMSRVPSPREPIIRGGMCFGASRGHIVLQNLKPSHLAQAAVSFGFGVLIGMPYADLYEIICAVASLVDGYLLPDNPPHFRRGMEGVTTVAGLLAVADSIATKNKWSPRSDVPMRVFLFLIEVGELCATAQHSADASLEAADVYHAMAMIDAGAEYLRTISTGGASAPGLV